MTVRERTIERILPKLSVRDGYGRRLLEKLMARNYDIEEIVDRMEKSGIPSLTEDEAFYVWTIYKLLEQVYKEHDRKVE